MKVLFLHGLEGSPTGGKVTYLRDAGLEVVAPALPKDDFAKSVDLAREHLTDDIGFVIGSSRGGAVALALGSTKPTILLAPAWKKYGFGTAPNPVPTTTSDKVFVFHGEYDDVIDFADSVKLKKHNERVSLVVNQDDHRQLNQMPALVEIIKSNP